MIDSEALSRLSPFDSLMPESLARVLPLLRAERRPAGHVLFRRGDEDPWSYYLVEGEVALRSDDASEPLVIRAGGESASRPLSRLKPRRYTATTLSPVTLAVMDDAELDRIVTLDQTAALEVTEFEGDDPEWMMTLLGHPAFAQVPAANFAELFALMEPMPVPGGQVIVRQGEAGDHYYLIRSGSAQVTQAVGGGPAAVVATLGAGDGFGEEALLSGDPRNATVTMLGEGLLMRLGREAFLRILGAPLVHWITPAEAAPLTVAGACLLDVRTADEFREGSLRGALNIPLRDLRLGVAALDRQRQYIVFCQSGHRSCAAAFLLSQRGFRVFVLRDGLKGLLRGRTPPQNGNG